MKSQIDRLIIDTENCRTALCELGQRFEADKSPLNPGKFRHAYTPIYNLLFAPKREKEINIAEIGIAYGQGLQLFRSYFRKANIFGFDINEKFIEHCKNLELQNTQIIRTDTGNPSSLKSSFVSANCKFDIIFDDGSHVLNHQLNTINYCIPFLKQGGIMIIEDIYQDQEKSPENEFLFA